MAGEETKGTTGFNLPETEERVLRSWKERGIFEKSLAKNKPKGRSAKGPKSFVFYEGPPYANGKPGIHHVLARVVKDVILRYKTMSGFYVPRKAGWDTHGLPVEMAAEKALGFKSKKDIEQYGVKLFNQKAKEQVWLYKDEWENMTRRIGYWLDLEDAYVTYEPEYIETLWWTMAQIAKRKLLYKGHKVVPWCTRCGTALSSHELAQGYKETMDNSVYMKFKLKPGQKFGDHVTKESAYILSWTTTPWTLPGNVALAVGEKISYSAFRVRGAKELYIMASDLVSSVFKNQEIDIVHENIKGKDLIGLEYEPLFKIPALENEKAYKIYPADFVTTTDGTGVVHTAVMYGEDDYQLGKKIGLPEHHTVNEEGKFKSEVPGVAGLYVKSKETEEKIFDHLRKKGDLLRTEPYTHEYPYCWRCGTAILYYARTSWFIAMSKLRKELLAANEKINWIPGHVKEGRFGEWLREVKDWNLSRERYWGAPLPIWECKKCGETEVVGSLDELSEKAGGAKNNYWVMRHGESESNVFHLIDSGPRNLHLTEKGRKQAETSLKKLNAALGKSHKKIDLIINSEVLRAQETAEIASRLLGVKASSDTKLGEMKFGSSMEGVTFDKFWKHVPTYEERFVKSLEGGETWKEVRERMWEVVDDCEARHSGKNILIVSHGDPILMLWQAAAGWSEKKIIAERDEVYLDTGEIEQLPVRVVPRNDTGEVDLHRPFADEITIPCKACSGEMHRVKEVADVWYDSGAMPFAQDHFPFAQPSAPGLQSQKLPAAYPADYIAEGMDQTRGWFYTLLAVATALGHEAPYKNVITFGLINDKFGQKMSKSKGNIVEPWAVINKYGVDAVRWYFYTGTPLGEPKNFDELEIVKSYRKMHLILWNSMAFWKTYADKTRGAVPKTQENILDKWVIARLNQTTEEASERLEKYEIREAALAIESFVDDLSRWYIRRSRRRLQRPASDSDFKAASATLGFVLRETAKLLAPFTPFFSEALHTELGGEEESVHLEDWPESSGKTDEKLIEKMHAARLFASLGLAKRAELGIKVRQPLASITAGEKLDTELQRIVADEVNVKKVIHDPKLKEGVLLDTAITPELKEEGIYREIARMFQELRQKGGLHPQDRIIAMLTASEEAKHAIRANEDALKSDVGAKSVEYKKSEKFNAEEIGKIDGQEIWVAIRKI